MPQQQAPTSLHNTALQVGVSCVALLAYLLIGHALKRNEIAIPDETSLAILIGIVAGGLLLIFDEESSKLPSP